MMDNFARALESLIRWLGAEGDLGVAEGSKTVVYTFQPKSRKDAGIVIGRQGKMIKALKTIVGAVGRNHSKVYEFQVEDVPDS